MDHAEKRAIETAKSAILIVEQTLPVADWTSLESSLLFLGFALRSVEGAVAALDMTNERRFDLAFVDMRFSKDDLDDTIKSLRHNHTPVLGLISRNKTDELLNKTCSVAVDDYLVLPVKHASFIEMVRRWIV